MGTQKNPFMGTHNLTLLVRGTGHRTQNSELRTTKGLLHLTTEPRETDGVKDQLGGVR